MTVSAGAQTPEPTSSTGSVELRIPARAEWVAVARLACSAVASRLRFSVDEIEDVKLAIAEACTNAIQRANGDGSIELVCDVSEDELRLTVRDHGPAMRPEVVDTRERIGDSGRTEDLGVFLIRALMDSVEYTSDPRNGTELIMTKRVFA